MMRGEWGLTPLPSNPQGLEEALCTPWTSLTPVLSRGSRLQAGPASPSAAQLWPLRLNLLRLFHHL